MIRKFLIIVVAITAISSWSVSKSAAQSQSTPATSDQLTGTLSGTSTGTVTSNPSGIDCPSTCTASFSSGTAVTLTAKAGKGAYFVGWSSPCSGDGKCKLTISASESTTAT